jgi:tetratricopeptide (TPR) repeat protein
MDSAELDSLVKRLVANPHDEEALAYAHRAGEEDPKAYAAFLEKVGERTTDPAYASHWLSEAANVYIATLGDAHRAAAILKNAIDKDPTHQVAAERLAQLYRERGEVKALVGLLNHRASKLQPLIAQQPELKTEVAALHEELGRLWSEAPLTNPKKALDSFKRAMELDPESAIAIFNARELMKSQGMWADVFPLYDRELKIEQDPARKVALLRDEAQARKASGDLAGATRTLSRARQIDGNDPTLQQEIASSVLDRVQGGEDVSQAERTEAAELLLALAEQYEGEHGMAYAGAALDLEPGLDRALQLYVYHARNLSREDDLSARYLAYVDANPGGAIANEARQSLASSYEAAGQLDNAIKMLEPLRPAGDEATISKLNELYEKTGGPQMAAASPAHSPVPANAGAPPPFSDAPSTSTNAQQDALQEDTAHGDPADAGPRAGGPGAGASKRESAPVRRTGALPPDKLQGVLDAAQMLAGKGKKAEAFSKYKEVLDGDPAHPEALAWAEDYLRTKRDYAQLRDVLLASVRVLGSISEGMEGRKERLREVAGLCEGQLRDIDGAVGAWKQLLAIDRSDDSARQSLTRLLERSQRWDDLANLYEQEATAAGDVDVKIALEKKLATLQEQKRRDFVAAAEAWSRIARLSSDDERAIATSAKLFEKGGQPAQAAQVIADNASSIEDPVARGGLLERLGEIREALNEIGPAGEAFFDAADAQRSAKLFENAERCFVASETWGRAAEAASRRAELAADAKQQASHFAHAADYLTKAGDDAAALEKLEQASDLDPTADETANALSEAYTLNEKWDTLAVFLAKRGDRIVDKAKRVNLRREAAVVFMTKLQDKEQAREQWLKVLEDGDDREALEKLVDYAVERDDHTEAATLLRRLGNIAVDKADKARIALREAELLAEGVGDIDTAIVRYESVLSDLDPTCRPALQAIADLQETRDNLPAAADALERELKLAADPTDRGQIAARLARLYERLDDPRAAIRALDMVRKADLEDFDALTRLCELCEKVEQWDRVATLLAERIEVEADDAEAATMTKKLAMVLADKLDRGDEALAVLTELADQGDTDIRTAYVDLGDRLGWKGLVGQKLCEWWFEARNGPERISALKSAFDRFAEVGRDQDAARVAIEIIRGKAGDRELAERLEELAIKTTDLDAMQFAHDLLIRDLQGSERAAEFVRQAEVSVRAGMNAEEAIQHGEQGLTSIAVNEVEPYLERLAKIAPRANDVLELYERQVSRCRTPADRMRALARAAQVAASKGQLERAKSFLELALSTPVPASTPGGSAADETVTVLEQYAAEGDKATGGEKLRRALCTALATGGGGARDGGRTRSALLRRAATIAQRDLSDVEQAFVWLGDALIAFTDAATLDAVEALGNQLDDPRRAEQAITRALSEVFDGPLVRQLLARRAKIRREHTGDRAGAAADLKKLHDLSPSDQAVLEELAALLRDLGDFRGMVQLYEDQILRGKDMAARAELARKVARMWEEQIQDPREAADAWRRVLRMKPADDEATQGLERAKTNMLKKPDPNAGPDAYAPPKLAQPSAPPPGKPEAKPETKPEAKAEAPKAEAKSDPKVAERNSAPKAVTSSPSVTKSAAASSPSIKADDKGLPPTVEVKGPSLFGNVDDDPEVDDALDALEAKPAAPAPSEKKIEDTAPNALSMDLINTIRNSPSKPPEKLGEFPAMKSSPLAPPSRPSAPTAKADDKKPRPPMKPLAPRSPSSVPPVDLSKTAAAPAPFHAIDEELHTTPGGAPVFRAALDDLDAKRDTDENAANGAAAAAADENRAGTMTDESAEDEAENTIMGKSFDFSDQTEIHHAEIPVDAGSEPMLVDDIAELVDEEDAPKEKEEEKPKPRTVPPPLPRN